MACVCIFWGMKWLLFAIWCGAVWSRAHTHKVLGGSNEFLTWFTLTVDVVGCEHTTTDEKTFPSVSRVCILFFIYLMTALGFVVVVNDNTTRTMMTMLEYKHELTFCHLTRRLRFEYNNNTTLVAFSFSRSSFRIKFFSTSKILVFIFLFLIQLLHLFFLSRMVHLETNFFVVLNFPTEWEWKSTFDEI